jgi:DNA invertase Pin-like site-specific DNA recombinase
VDCDGRRRRQAAGITKANAVGQFRGRSENVEQQAKIAKMLAKGMSWGDIADALKCSRSTIPKVAKRLREAGREV